LVQKAELEREKMHLQAQVSRETAAVAASSKGPSGKTDSGKRKATKQPDGSWVSETLN
jgi:hypothetical protein